MATKLSLVPRFLHDLAAWLEAEGIVVIKRERGRRVLAERLARELPPFADRDGFAGSASDLYEWLASQRHLFAVPGRDRALYRALRERMLPRLPSPAALVRADEVLAALHEASRVPRAELDAHRTQAAQNLDYEARPDWVEVDALVHAQGFAAFVPPERMPPGLIARALAPLLERQRRGAGPPEIHDAQELLYEWDMSWDDGAGRWLGSAWVDLPGASEPIEVDLSIGGQRDLVPDVQTMRRLLCEVDARFAELCAESAMNRDEAVLRLQRLGLSLEGAVFDLRAFMMDDAPLIDAGE